MFNMLLQTFVALPKGPKPSEISHVRPLDGEGIETLSTNVVRLRVQQQFTSSFLG